MLTDWELWACANQVIQQYGPNAPNHVAERIGACVAAGDIDGIATWKAIARRIVELGNSRGRIN